MIYADYFLSKYKRLETVWWQCARQCVWPALALANGTAKTLKRAKKNTLSLLTIAISQLVTMPFHVFVTISPELTTTLALAGSLAHWSRLANLVFVYTLFSKLVNIERS